MTGKLNHLNKNSDSNDKIYMSSRNKVSHSNKCLSKFSNKFLTSPSLTDFNNKNIILVDDEQEKEEYIIKDEFKNNDISSINNINNINLYESVDLKTNKDEKTIKEEKERSDLKERVRKSRRLRHLMNKKASEKQELLRYYFFKFYRAGLFISRFKAYSQRRKSCQLIAPINMDLTQLSSKYLTKINKKELNKNEEKEKEEDSKEKLTEILQKIFYKADRRNMIILNKVFKKFYLKVKLESLKDVLDHNKDKKKKRKLKRRNTTVFLKRNDKMNYFKGEKAKSAEIEIED
jgi:hypothetical protein